MNKIFVFGSNYAGAHGAGAAYVAYKSLGAERGVGIGPTGKCYALPTKDYSIRTLPLAKVKEHVNDFIEYAKAHPTETFQVTRIGCGLAGFKDSDIAPMFSHAPSNCYFDSEWEPYLGLKRHYWGTY